MVDPSPGRTIFKAIRASLRLARDTPQLLTTSGLHAVMTDLRETLAMVETEIQIRDDGTHFR